MYVRAATVDTYVQFVIMIEFAKPYIRPDYTRNVEFRYTLYVRENHPAAHKVVAQFNINSLKLDDKQRHKFLVLCGPRYQPKTGIIKISCETEQSVTENKEKIKTIMNDLVAEAKVSNV